MSGIDFAAIGARAHTVSVGAFTDRDAPVDAVRLHARGDGDEYDAERAWVTAQSSQPPAASRSAAGDLGLFAAARSNADHQIGCYHEQQAWFASYLRRHPAALAVAGRARDAARRAVNAEAALELAERAVYAGTGTGWPRGEIVR